MNIAIEFVAKGNIDNFLSITRQERLKEQLSELDFKLATGQRILSDEEKAKSEEQRQRLDWEQQQEYRSNFSTSELRAFDESNFAYFK